MKKIVSVLLVNIIVALPLAAFDEHEVENAVLRAQVSQKTQKPELPAWKQQLLPAWLAKAEDVMRQDNIEYLNPAQLGEALVSSVSRVMELNKEERTGEFPEQLSAEEQRAVYYAIYTLLPAKNRVGIMTFQEYSAAYPVKDWDEFSMAAQEALELVYQAVSDIARKADNYRYSWLFLLTH